MMGIFSSSSRQLEVVSWSPEPKALPTPSIIDTLSLASTVSVERKTSKCFPILKLMNNYSAKNFILNYLTKPPNREPHGAQRGGINKNFC
jgi:hypothetical protein